MGAPKGNHNALKHGLFSKHEAGLVVIQPSRPAGLQPAGSTALRDPAFAIPYLEQAIEAIGERLRVAQGEEFTRLANSLALATTALFNGHRTLAFLTGEVNQIDRAVKELETLEFDED